MIGMTTGFPPENFKEKIKEENVTDVDNRVDEILSKGYVMIINGELLIGLIESISVDIKYEASVDQLVGLTPIVNLVCSLSSV